MHEQQDHQETALAAELERIKLDRLTEEKMRQQIRQTRSPTVVTYCYSHPGAAAAAVLLSMQSSHTNCHKVKDVVCVYVNGVYCTHSTMKTSCSLCMCVCVCVSVLYTLGHFNFGVTPRSKI